MLSVVSLFVIFLSISRPFVSALPVGDEKGSSVQIRSPRSELAFPLEHRQFEQEAAQLMKRTLSVGDAYRRITGTNGAYIDVGAVNGAFIGAANPSFHNRVIKYVGTAGMSACMGVVLKVETKYGSAPYVVVGHVMVWDIHMYNKFKVFLDFMLQNRKSSMTPIKGWIWVATRGGKTEQDSLLTGIRQLLDAYRVTYVVKGRPREGESGTVESTTLYSDGDSIMFGAQETISI